MRRLLMGTVIAVVFGLLSGCATGQIPGTLVDDTVENREIHSMVEAYRQAVEKRDSEAIGKLVSRRYFENASTTDVQTDDYGYEKLAKNVLKELKENVKKAQYRIILKKVVFRGNRALAEYEYFWRFQYTEGGREQWIARNDFNRLDFIREDDTWKIISGL